MIKRGILIALIIMISILKPISAIVISEVELNPQGTDAGAEWIELYSRDTVNLDGYKLTNNDGKEILLNGSFSGYYTITFNRQWLDNVNEMVSLYNEGVLVDESEILTDNDNNQKTWQFCEGWQKSDNTRGKVNDCNGKIEEEDESAIEDLVQDNKEKKITKTFNLVREINKNETRQEESENKDLQADVIKLGAKNIKTSENTNFKETGDYAFYALAAFAFLLVILFLLKGKKYRNEFRKD